MDVIELYQRASNGFRAWARAVRPEDLGRPTPCADWDVRALVHHVVEEELWAPPLLEGATIEEVGDRLAGDLLGEDATGAVERAAEAAERAVAGTRPPRGKVHLSYGDEEPDEYVRQLVADHLVHGWDLATATGGDTRLDPELVTEVAVWFAEREEMYRGVGVIGPRPPGSYDDPQDRLLAAFGRDPQWVGTGAGI